MWNEMRWEGQRKTKEEFIVFLELFISHWANTIVHSVFFFLFFFLSVIFVSYLHLVLLPSASLTFAANDSNAWAKSALRVCTQCNANAFTDTAQFVIICGLCGISSRVGSRKFRTRPNLRATLLKLLTMSLSVSEFHICILFACFHLFTFVSRCFFLNVKHLCNFRGIYIVCSIIRSHSDLYAFVRDSTMIESNRIDTHTISIRHKCCYS